MRKILLGATLMAAMTLSGCANEMGNKEMMGTGLGAVVGGLAGSQFGKGNGQVAMAVAGGLLGAMAGQSIGKSLDKADMMYLNQAETKAYTAPIGQTISWNNPQSGHSGTVTPVRDGYSSGGQYCREYSQTIFVDGKKETATGTACKKSDGTWQIAG